MCSGVSVDYYVRLEQGRGTNVSDAVLDAVARVLRLTDTEAAHLRDLVRPKRDRGRGRGAGARGGAGRTVRTGVRTLMETMTGTPAFVLGRRMDILAWNALADAVSGFSAMPEGERDAARTPSSTRRPGSSTSAGPPWPRRRWPICDWTRAGTPTTL